MHGKIYHISTDPLENPITEGAFEHDSMYSDWAHECCDYVEYDSDWESGGIAYDEAAADFGHRFNLNIEQSADNDGDAVCFEITEDWKRSYFESKYSLFMEKLPSALKIITDKDIFIGINPNHNPIPALNYIKASFEGGFYPSDYVVFGEYGSYDPMSVDEFFRQADFGKKYYLIATMRFKG